MADQDFARTPTSLLGARQSVLLARYAGAERDATAELSAAAAKLSEAENAWRLKQPEAEVDALARRATELGAQAEEVAAFRKSARERRDEIARRDRAVRDAERTAEEANAEISDLRQQLDRSERARELSDRDLANTSQQLRDLRSENSRLRDELQQARTEAEQAKLRVARFEGERAVEDARRDAEQKAAQRQAQAAALRQALTRFGTLRESAGGVTLTLPDTIFAGARSADLAPASASKLEPLAALLANYPDFRIQIDVVTDNRGDELTLRQLAQARAQVLAERLVSSGVETARIQASGMGPDSPVAPNTTPAGRTRNRRVEITLTPPEATSAASN